MPRFQYFVAASIDGFIATSADNLDWLLQFDGFDGGTESYEAFMAEVGCLVMGGDTYSWLLENAPGEWPYAGKPCFVFTHHEFTAVAGADITFVRGDVTEFAADFRQAAGAANTWVVGGGNMAAQFAAASLLDEIILSTIPVVLGDGKRLLPLAGPTSALELTSSRTLGRGIVESRYLLTPAG